MEYVRCHTLSEVREIERLSDKEIDLTFESPLYEKNFVPLFVKEVESLLEKGFFLTVHIDSYQRNFTENEFTVLFFLKEGLAKSGLELYFSNQYKSTYTIEEILRADEKLDAFIRKLKDSPLSPLERFLCIYKHLWSYEYKGSKNEEDAYASRDLVAVINGEGIVCEGYSELLRYYCENVGIECLFHPVYLGEEKHLNNLVLIQDKKYGIDGLYYADATWDAPDDTYSFCLLPLSDVSTVNTAISVLGPYRLFYAFSSATLYVLVDSYSSALLPIRYVDISAETFSVIDDGDDEFVTILGKGKEVRETYDFALKWFLSHKDEAIPKLTKILKEEGVAPRIYSDYAGFIPAGTSLPFLLALLMIRPNGDALIRSRIKALFARVEEGSEDLLVEEGTHYDVEDIYKVLQDALYLDEKAYDVSQEAFERRLYDLGKSGPYSEYKALQFVEKCVEALRRMKAIDLCRAEIKRKYPLGEAIPSASFVLALRNVYAFEGKEKEEAEKKIEASIRRTVTLSKNAFGEGATNAFATYKENE